MESVLKTNSIQRVPVSSWESRRSCNLSCRKLKVKVKELIDLLFLKKEYRFWNVLKSKCFSAVHETILLLMIYSKNEKVYYWYTLLLPTCGKQTYVAELKNGGVFKWSDKMRTSRDKKKKNECLDVLGFAQCEQIKKKKCIKLHLKKKNLCRTCGPHPLCVFLPGGCCCLCSAGQLAAPQTGWRFVLMRPEAEGPDYRQTKHCCVLLGSGAEHRFKN